MNVGIGTVVAQFLFWEYLFQIFGIVSLQCNVKTEKFVYANFILKVLYEDKHISQRGTDQVTLYRIALKN